MKAERVGATRLLGEHVTERRRQEFDGARHCWCGQRIGVYNPNPTCYLHTKTRKKILPGVSTEHDERND